jgi:hypothetical protein
MTRRHKHWQNNGAPVDFSKQMAEAVKASAKAKLRGYTTAKQLATGEFPQQEWLLDRLILKGCANPLWGDAFVGKSTWITQVGVALAAAQQAIFRRAIKPATVLLILGEDGAGENKKRATAAAEAIGHKLEDLPIAIVSKDPLTDYCLAKIDTFGNPTRGPYMPELIKAINDTRRHLGKPDGHVLVALDSLEEFFPGVTDNFKDEQIRTLLDRVLLKVCTDFNLTIVLIAHPSATQVRNGRMTNGKQAWRSIPRSMITFQKKGRSNRSNRVIVDVISNYAPSEPITLQRQDDLFTLVSTNDPRALHSGEIRPGLVAKCAELAVRAKPTLHRPRGPSGRTKWPTDFRAKVDDLYQANDQILVTPAMVWQALEAAVENGLLEYRPRGFTRPRQPAGYYLPSVW